jgi:hypothetical protein
MIKDVIAPESPPPCHQGARIVRHFPERDLGSASVSAEV